MASMLPTVESLWCSLLVSLIRWTVSVAISEPRALLAVPDLEMPSLRSRLGKHIRRSVCPELKWQHDCGSCARMGDCLWPRMLPGSAVGLPAPAALASWLLTMDQGALLSTHFHLDPAEFQVFGRALDAAFADALGLDRRRPGTDPRWLCPVLMNGEATQPILPLAWSAPVPMSPPPPPLAEGRRLRFQVPLDLKTATQANPPPMGDWLRLGRNRAHHLITQNGFRVWDKADPRWAGLTRDAAQAAWQWNDSKFGTPWKPVAKYRLELKGWMGEVRIEHLPDSWIPWATLLPVVGVGSHIPYGCGVGSAQPPADVAVEAQGCKHPVLEPHPRIIPLKWRAGLGPTSAG